MLDAGPCRTCPRAAGILISPSGLAHTCAPEEWGVCNVLHRWSKTATATGLEPRSRNHRRGWRLVRKTRIAVQLFRRSLARSLPGSQICE
jgi:hypothetical protein